MSRLTINLSYKNCCILKHALREQVIRKLEVIELADEYKVENYSDKLSNSEFLKELEEDRKCLSLFTRMINELIDKERSESNSSRETV